MAFERNTLVVVVKQHCRQGVRRLMHKNQCWKGLNMFLDSIEANVESAHTDVRQGTEQLDKARNYQV